MPNRFQECSLSGVRRRIIALAGVVAFVVFVPRTGEAGSITRNQLDVVTLKSFSSGQDVEGSLLVGTNVVGSTWQASSNPSTSASTPTVIVGGSFAGTVHVEQGSLLISGPANLTSGS
jgi:hypothetical protein